MNLGATDVDPDWISPEHLDHLRHNSDARDLLEEEYRTILEDLHVLRSEVLLTGDNSINLPVNLKRLIWNAQTKFGCREHRYGQDLLNMQPVDCPLIISILMLPPCDLVALGLLAGMASPISTLSTSSSGSRTSASACWLYRGSTPSPKRRSVTPPSCSSPLSGPS